MLLLVFVLVHVHVYLPSPSSSKVDFVIVRREEISSSGFDLTLDRMILSSKKERSSNPISTVLGHIHLHIREKTSPVIEASKRQKGDQAG